MTLIDKIKAFVPKFKSKKPSFEGVIIGAILDGEDIDLQNGKQIIRYCKYTARDILGYDNDGIPIIDDYNVGRYKIRVRNSQGEVKEFHQYGREPKIGSKYTQN